MDRVFRLGLGQVGPLQQSEVSCGAACLVVARMLRDPSYAGWVVNGPDGDPRTPNERFASLERRTMRRTNSSLAYPGRPQLPWPRALGTSPWGAAAELEANSADPGYDYRVVPVRGLGRAALGGAYDAIVARVRPGAPVLLYVGSAALPRHVCLLFAGAQDRTVLVYEPACGAVDLPSRDRFASAQLGLAGWDRPWFLVAPGAPPQIAGKERVRRLAPVPRANPGAALLREQ
ncbi:MAG: hypothetical protein IPK37_15460 [Austwickia sp.]|nr:MAG: hypothetical protein IPK37_15460 [Austwickia sp.]